MKDVTRDTNQLKMKRTNDTLQKHYHLVNNVIRNNDKNTPIVQEVADKSKMIKRTRSTTTAGTTKVFDEKDKAFLSHFLDMDDKGLIDAQNLHLLTDDDSNKSITAREKYQKLADLMMDDKEIIVEHSFSIDQEEKMILNLFCALSRKSKQVFIEEDLDKINKLQVFFKRINGIPDFNQTEAQSPSVQPKSPKKEKRNSVFNEDVYANKLKNAPKISSEFLSNINHNFISIEDIGVNDFARMTIKQPPPTAPKGPLKAVDVTKRNEWESGGSGYICKFVINDQKEKEQKKIEMAKESKMANITSLKNENLEKIKSFTDVQHNYYPTKTANMSKGEIYRYAQRHQMYMQDCIEETAIEESFLYVPQVEL